MKCIVKEKSRRAVAVIYRDHNGWQGRVITDPAVLRLSIGETVDLDAAMLDESGAEYGIDFGIVVGQITVTPEQVSDIFRAHGIWTVSDLTSNPKEVSAACQSLSNVVHGRVLAATRQALGE